MGKGLLLLAPKLNTYQAKLIAVVHDEIILECPIGQGKDLAPVLEQCMREAGAKFIHEVPIEAEAKVCTNWAEK